MGFRPSTAATPKRLLKSFDPDIEWHDAFAVMLGGEETVYRGHKGAREAMSDLHDTFVEIDTFYSEFHHAADQVVAVGRVRARGGGSGAEIESPS